MNNKSIIKGIKLSVVFFEMLISLSLFAQIQPQKQPAENEIWVGATAKSITPPVALRNWVTGKPYAAIHDSIYVRAIVLRKQQKTVAVISWELVDAGESATARLRERIHEECNIPQANILLNATHNHSAPWSPVYEKGLRGEEVETWWTLRYMPSQLDSAVYSDWAKALIDQSVLAVKTALNKLTTCSVWLGRSDISGLVRNRRPRSADWGIIQSGTPEDFNYKHDYWDPQVLGDGMNFGEIDRSLDFVSFRDANNNQVASIFHMSAHAVAIYPFQDGISGDWPGATLRLTDPDLGGVGLFLQGTAGDINPARRGQEAVNHMAMTLAQQMKSAYKYAARLEVDSLIIGQSWVGLPLTDYGRKSTGLETIPAEMQMLAIGPMVLISLPGEPMTGIGREIRKRSPFPQTLVLGYSNGKGSYYIGLPGEKRFGGYESGEKTSIGTDAAGQILIESAVQLLIDNYPKNRN
ncbi:MAG: hypothetical protein HKN76_19175 [Saprospiraceae bacterium]|nr:hypothetical protein [Saprospiraceae bacterium]